MATRLPLGESLIDAVSRFKSGVKQLLLPGMLFEELGFTYLGPIDGHSLPALIETLHQARALAVQRVQGGRVLGQGEDRARTLFRFDAGMRALAVDRDVVST